MARALLKKPFVFTNDKRWNEGEVHETE